MATDTDRTTFKSNFRNKDQPRSVGNARVRRMFETSGADGNDSSTVSSRYHDRSESSSVTSTRGAATVTSKIEQLSLNNENHDDHQTEADQDDVKRDDDVPSTRRFQRREQVQSNYSSSRGAEEDEKEPEKDADEDAPRKTFKKPGASAGAGKKRKEKKNLREKRRSTGVVIMPGQGANENDEEAMKVARNTALNQDDNIAVSSAVDSSADSLNYQETIGQLQEELAAKHKELDTLKSQMDTLRSQNMRLKDENSALLRVVGSLSGTGGGR